MQRIPAPLSPLLMLQRHTSGSRLVDCRAAKLRLNWRTTASAIKYRLPWLAFRDRGRSSVVSVDCLHVAVEIHCVSCQAWFHVQ